MSLPRYPEYKDSEMEWLGEVPSHWLIAPVKWLGKLKGGAGFPHVEQGHGTEELPFHKVNALSRADGDGVLWGSANTISRVTAERLGAYVFPARSLVFAKVGAALLLGRVRRLGESACLDNNMMGLIVDSDIADVMFVHYALNLVKFDLIANPGAVPSLNERQIGDFTLVLPNRAEQTAIAGFLDRETVRIDALIAEQEKLLALLAEKREATISHAVTRGLDPNVPMKDSGIAWLGEVPAHWCIGHLRRCLEHIMSGTTATQVEERRSTVAVTRIETISSGEIDFSRVGFVEPDEALTRRLMLRGDILFSNINSLGMIGNCAQYQGGAPLYVGMNLLSLRPKSEAHRRWLYWTVRSRGFRGEVESRSKPAINQASIPQSSIAEIAIAIPTRDEQHAISAFLDRVSAETADSMEEVRKVIRLLAERRSALISAAVTGQIDVRGLFDRDAA